MSESLNEIAPLAESPDARREMLSQQFDEMVENPPDVRPEQEERVRAPDGKFAPRQAQEQQETQDVAEEPVWSRPPASWKKDYHEVWKTADPKLREYAWQREEQMRAGVEPLISKAQFADQMQEVITPFESTIRGLGLQPKDAVKALLEADHSLRYSTPQEKVQLFSRLAQQYGVNLGQIEQSPQQNPIDPTIYALQNELNKVRGEVMTWKEQQEQVQNQSLLGEINQFAQKAEYFEEARPVMVQLLQSGVAQTLEDAYEKAIRLDSNLFDTVQQSRQAELDSEKRSRADKAAKSARAAAVSVRSSTPGVVTATKAQDRRGLLAEQFDAIGSRF
jgi:hypothetical protein